MFFFDLLQLFDVAFSIEDFSFELRVALDNFFELMVLIIKVISKDTDEVSVGEVVETVYKIISDLNIEETVLSVHNFWI